MAKQTSPYDVELPEDEETALAHFLQDEIQAALDARETIIGEGGDISYWQWYYEQGQSRASSKRWPGAADLTSYLITEAVDAMRARMVKTVFVEPFWIVEGWGDSAKKAPFVEEFHQWKLEEERLQGYVGKALHTSLIEGTGILEVAERAEKRKYQSTEDIAIELDDDGTPILDEKHQPTLKRHPETGDFIPLTGPGSASVAVSRMKTINKGPQYRLVSLKDFLFLPGHAKDDSEVFGRCKRFHRRLVDLKAKEKQGIYRNVDRLSETSDRVGNTFETRDGTQIAPQQGSTIEKELWELQILLDLDKDGIEEYYLVTISVQHGVILRVCHDDIGQERFLAYRPFPRPDSVYGYSYVQKLITLAEEHTALRNMIADRSALATNAPILRVQGALWDPMEQRFGVGAVIDVRDKNELTQMQIHDVPPSAIERERNVLQGKERLSGQNDVAVGQSAEQGTTLGEIQIRTEQSFVRMDEAVRYIQETNEDLFQLRHTLWVRALEADQEGIEPPDSFKRSLEMRNVQMESGRITADQLKGTFRGKPRGSTDTANLEKAAQNYNNWIQTMAQLAQMSPAVMAQLTQPAAMQALIEEGLRVNRVRDRQAFLTPPPMPMLPPGMPGQPPAAGALPPGIAGMLPAGPPAPQGVQ